MKVIIPKAVPNKEGWIEFACPYCGTSFSLPRKLANGAYIAYSCQNVDGTFVHYSNYTGTLPNGFRVERESPLSLLAERFK